MKKRALVLAGGGSRGSYQVGVWRALRELAWDFDIITGTSVGALNGALAVQGDFSVAANMWETISTSDVLDIDLDKNAQSLNLREVSGKLAVFLGDMAKNGGADPRPLEDMLRRCINEERVRTSPKDFAFVTVEYPSFTPRIISKADIPEGALVDYLMASAACFPAMKMRQIGATRYIDGGYYDNMPVQLAIERGAEEIVAVDLEAIGRHRRVPTKARVRVHHIRSRWELGLFLRFDQTVAQRNMQLGYLDALKAFGRLEGEAYAFQKGEVQANAPRLATAFLALAGKTGFGVQKYGIAAQEGEKSARLARVVRFRAATQPPTAATIAAAAETAARVFGLSPLEVYTFDAFNAALLDRAGAITSDGFSVLEQAMGSSKTTRDFVAAAGRIDRSFIAAYFLAQLRRCIAGEETRLLPLMATFAPEEYIAAFYLAALGAEYNGTISPLTVGTESGATARATADGNAAGGARG